ncbi:hypothetical protein BN439_1764 [Erwinia amylovora Ea644]|nr:hypothetical protein BN439_1764 [Erwinia amylovora Ea644]CCP06855.1 hypothetical protein BN440_1828 [Erwinia amylovora MR1]
MGIAAFKNLSEIIDIQDCPILTEALLIVTALLAALI